MVRYSGQVAAVAVDRPFSGELSPAAWAEFAPRNFIDDHALARWKQLQIPPSPTATDAEFLRRASLDLTGQLPSETEVTDFLASPPSMAKRDALIERLLSSEAFVDLWTMRFADLLLISGKRGSEAGARAYHFWLRDQVAQNRAWSEIVRELLTAEGPIDEIGPANFAALANDPRDLAEHVGNMFLGTQIGCARCHAHPSDRWTQSDYYQFAAYFARVSLSAGQVREADRGEIRHPKTSREVSPQPLFALPGARQPAASNRRAQIADWVASPENPLFARALANRVWAHLMGRGLVEPLNDLRPTNPASNPPLLAALADRLAASGYDWRGLVRVIVQSSTYQRSSQTVPGNERDDRFYSYALPKSPSAPVLLDMIAQATGVPERFADQPEAARAVQLVGAQTPSLALDALGRCARQQSCESPATAGGGLAQALHLINGETIHRRTSAGVLTEIRAEKISDEAAVDRLYRRTLSRPPHPAEAAEWKALLANSSDRAAALEDLLWALLNSRAFVLIR